MRACRLVAIFVIGILAVLKLTATFAAASGPAPVSLAPGHMPRMGAVDERFQSFNIEMLEVTGGNFWKPYSKWSDSAQKPGQPGGSAPAGMNPNMYQYRPPIDLANPRLRKLAAALGPAYVRVSGTWANTTYFHDSDEPAPSKPPEGFNGVLTRQQWKGVVDFSRAVNARIVTSLATSTGTRDAAGVWTPQEASKFLAFTRSAGGDVAAAEFMNEPTIAAMGGAPKGYDAASYGRDMAVFVPFMRKTAPEILILGPGSVGEGGVFPMAARFSFLKSEDLLRATGPVLDVFSYHFYGAASKRCASMGSGAMTTAEAALSDGWLSRTDKVEAFYAGLRDQFEPGKPLWITETADAACGGNPWASSFLDSFRYLNQLGTMAQSGVQVVAHNTLDASDYGLLDENTYAPRPNYWAALLWRKLMGTTVLNPGVSFGPGLHIYSQCLRGVAGGVAILVINADRSVTRSLAIAAPSRRYTLTAADLMSSAVQLNGSDLKLGADDALPELRGLPTGSGDLEFAPGSITFLELPKANNAACRIGQ